MNNTIHKLLLAGEKFMPEMHLRQPQFTYSACGPFTKHKQRIKKFKETGDTNYIYIKMNYIRLVLFMMQHILIVKILQKEPLQIKFQKIKHLILLRIQNMMGIKKD